jgi:hypothetical protein
MHTTVKTAPARVNTPPTDLLGRLADYEDLLEIAEDECLAPQVVARRNRARRALYAWFGAGLDLVDPDAVALWRSEIEAGIAELEAILKAGGVDLSLREAEAAFAALAGSWKFSATAH